MLKSNALVQMSTVFSSKIIDFHQLYYKCNGTWKFMVNNFHVKNIDSCISYTYRVVTHFKISCYFKITWEQNIHPVNGWMATSRSSWCLSQYSLVALYGNIDLHQHSWRHQAIARTNIDLPLVESSYIQLGTVIQQYPNHQSPKSARKQLIQISFNFPRPVS